MIFGNNRLRRGNTSDGRVKTMQGLHRMSMCLALCLVMTLTFSAQAHAQSASFRSVDANRDGVLSLEELISAFGRAGAERLLRQSDRNNDTTLTIQELRQRSDDDDRGADRTSRGNDDDRDDDDGGDDDGGDDDGGDDDGGDDD